MTVRSSWIPRCAAVVALAILLGGEGGSVRASPASAVLEEARALFHQGRWGDARDHLRARTDSLSGEEREIAQLVIGRAYLREAELYRWVRTFSNEVGLDYLGELESGESGQGLPWIPLFKGFYELAAGRPEAADRSLARAASLDSLPKTWRTVASRRRAVAAHHLGAEKGARPLKADRSYEARFWRLMLDGSTNGVAAPGEAPRERDRLWAAPVLLREGRPEEAESLLRGFDPDAPSAEHRTDARTVLRFFDPLILDAWERMMWEQALISLRPVVEQGEGPRRALASYYAGLARLRMGESGEARNLLGAAAGSDALGNRLRARARVLLGASESDGASPGSRAELWEATRDDPEAVLLWADASPRGGGSGEPFATRLPGRLHRLGESFSRRTSRATVGRWGLVLLQGGAEPSEVVPVLSRLRDNANKNKIERNDPLLLLAVVVANYRDSDYAQALETLFALSEAYPGLRGLHWNLQGTYAARQKAGGEARISQ